MFSIIKTGGKQYLVKGGDVIEIERSSDDKLPAVVTLAHFDGKNWDIGTPLLEKSEVTLELVAETTGPKIKIIKHRAKKHSRTRQGHRQKLLKVKVHFGKFVPKSETKAESKPATKEAQTKKPTK